MCSNSSSSSSLSSGWQEVPPQQGAMGCHRVTHATNSVQFSPVQLSPAQSTPFHRHCGKLGLSPQWPKTMKGRERQTENVRGSGSGRREAWGGQRTAEKGRQSRKVRGRRRWGQPSVSTARGFFSSIFIPLYKVVPLPILAYFIIKVLAAQFSVLNSLYFSITIYINIPMYIYLHLILYLSLCLYQILFVYTILFMLHWGFKYNQDFETSFFA